MSGSIIVAVVACVVVIVLGGIASWVVRLVLAEAALQREALFAQLQQTLDRVEAPGATAASKWDIPEAPHKSDAEIDREWMSRPESAVEFDPDLILADMETREG